MIKKVNGCVDCGLPCLSYCKYKDDSYEYYCDECGDECSQDELYVYEDENKQLCQSCLLSKFKKVENF